MTPRVLYLHEFSRMGGAELALLRLIEAIRPAGVEPLVVWPRNDAIFARLSSQGIRVVRLKVPRWRHGLSLPLLPVCLLRLRQVLSRRGVDLVHVNNYRSAPFGLLVARWAGVPCVSTVREMIAPDKVRQYRLRRLDALVAVCDSVARILVDAGVPQDRVGTVRSGVSLPPMPTESARRKLRESLGNAADDPLIGIVAHILPHKGFDDLVQALPLIVRRIPRVRCLVVGEAPRKRYMNHLLELAERLAVRDRLVWVGAQDDVPRFLAAMDLFVLPSHTEGLPLTVLEAMAAGRPVVGTAVGGIPEAVRHGETGFVVPPRDPRRLAEAVIDVLANPALAKSMGEAGRARAGEAFTLDAEARQTRAQYCRVLGARCESPAADGMETEG
jgi:glycosyltransferase involved in cell wall biosynthesis